MSIDLNTLPAPEVIEALDYETILAGVKRDFLARAPEFADLIDLESEPAVKLLETIAYLTLVQHNRINSVARSNLLAFAVGTDLDHLAAFYGVSRLPAEPDERLRQRVQLQIAAIAGNGSREQYRARAMAASIHVVDAAVLRPAIGSVELALWVADGADSGAVVAQVSAAMADDAARMLGVPLTVRLAVPRVINVSAVVYREATAPVDMAQRLATALPAAVASHAQLGRDLARSMLVARLHTTGVSRIELSAPASDVILAPDEYAVLGAVDLQDGGVSW